MGGTAALKVRHAVVVMTEAMATPFTFLSNVEFERLGFPEKLAYLSAAMAEMKRAKRKRRRYRWDDLFSQPPPPYQKKKLPKT